MKLVTFATSARECVGVHLGNNELLDLPEAERKLFSNAQSGCFDSMLSLIRYGERALERAAACIDSAPAEAVHALSEVTLRAPLPNPTRLRDAGMFVEHIEVIRKEMAQIAAESAPDPQAKLEELLQSEQFQVPKILYERVCYYNGNHLAIIGPDEQLQWPNGANILDYELELGVVLGKSGYNLTAEQAKAHVFGYTVMNDWSARDIQVEAAKSGAGPCMGKDFGTSLGPCIVTADEVPDPHSLEMTARLNNAEVSRGSTRNMHHTVFDSIAEFSRLSPIECGEVIGSGTPAYGSASENGHRLVPGDVVQLEIERIGILTNQVGH